MKKQMGFEKALKRIEEIVEEMESGEAELDKSLSMYEEGISFIKYCSAKLDEAKKKVEILSKSGSSLKAVPFKDNSKEE